MKYYYNDQYAVTMSQMMKYGTTKQVDYSKYYVNKYYQRILGCEGWGHQMPFYVPADYPQPWIQMTFTNLVGGVVALSAVGAVAIISKKQ